MCCGPRGTHPRPRPRPHPSPPGEGRGRRVWRGHLREARTGTGPSWLAPGEGTSAGGPGGRGCWLVSFFLPSPSGKTFCNEQRDRRQLCPLSCLVPNRRQTDAHGAKCTCARGPPTPPGSPPLQPQDADPHSPCFPGAWAVTPGASSSIWAGDRSARVPDAVGPDQPLALSSLTGDPLGSSPS